MSEMLLLIDIGNTHTHLGLAEGRRVVRHTNISTQAWDNRAALPSLRRFVGRRELHGAALCSVVPSRTAIVREAVSKLWGVPCLELTSRTVTGIRIEYPNPKTIGPDRLANAVAARHHFGAPVVVVDFGTAVTFDVVNRTGSYVGGIIAPGLAALTEYLHEKTALLPRIKIREVRRAVGKSTEEAMLIGIVHGYRGLVRELLKGLRVELGSLRLQVVATGGYGKLMAKWVPEITRIDPLLTLEGLRLVWQARNAK
jgi:type III pantothenate kinase